MNGCEDRKNECWEKVLEDFPDDGYLYVQPLKYKYKRELNSNGLDCIITDSYVIDRMINDDRYTRFDVPTCCKCMMALCIPEESERFDMNYCDNCGSSLKGNIYYRIEFKKVM